MYDTAQQVLLNPAPAGAQHPDGGAALIAAAGKCFPDDRAVRVSDLRRQVVHDSSWENRIRSWCMSVTGWPSSMVCRHSWWGSAPQ
jgi:hypothetical protein